MKTTFDVVQKTSTWTTQDSEAALAQGWDVFDCDVERQLQRHDESKIFPDDCAAAAFVKAQALKGDVLAIKAITHLIEWNSPDIQKFGLVEPKIVSPVAKTSTEAEGHLKTRATALAKALTKYNVSLKHGQVLTLLARVEGYKSFSALKASLTRDVPGFCPHCGAAGTIKGAGTVYCEQGEYNGSSYEAEGEGAQYACTRCNGQFTDWCGIDVGLSDEVVVNGG